MKYSNTQINNDTKDYSRPLGPENTSGKHFLHVNIATGSDSEIAHAFNEAHRMLAQRIGIFASLPITALDGLTLQKRIEEIGRMEGATPGVPKHGSANPGTSKPGAHGATRVGG